MTDIFLYEVNPNPRDIMLHDGTGLATPVVVTVLGAGPSDRFLVTPKVQPTTQPLAVRRPLTRLR